MRKKYESVGISTHRYTIGEKAFWRSSSFFRADPRLTRTFFLRWNLLSRWVFYWNRSKTPRSRSVGYKIGQVCMKNNSSRWSGWSAFIMGSLHSNFLARFFCCKRHRKRISRDDYITLNSSRKPPPCRKPPPLLREVPESEILRIRDLGFSDVIFPAPGARGGGAWRSRFPAKSCFYDAKLSEFSRLRQPFPLVNRVFRIRNCQNFLACGGHIPL